MNVQTQGSTNSQMMTSTIVPVVDKYLLLFFNLHHLKN